jgi:predicted glycoside hydrolase/deacetylase ChbG (UPF0249 family)
MIKGKRRSKKNAALGGAKKLILSSDDYGFSKAVNDGILKAVEMGTITCAHVLMNLASEDDVRLLANTIHKAGNKCGIGLHLNTNTGPSVLNKQCSLTPVKKGNHYPFVEMEDFRYKDVSISDVAAEMWAQYHKLANIIGAERIDSISSHYNIHVFSKAYLSNVVQIARAANIPIRSPLRWVTKVNRTKLPKYPHGKKVMPITWEGIIAGLKLGGGTFGIMSVTLPKRDKQLVWRRKKIRKYVKTPDNLSAHWLGQPDLDALQWSYEELKKISKSGFSTEVLMHLAASPKPMTGDYSAAYEMDKRFEEFEVITAPETAKFCENLYSDPDVELGSFRKVLLGQSISYDLDADKIA